MAAAFSTGVAVGRGAGVKSFLPCCELAVACVVDEDLWFEEEEEEEEDEEGCFEDDDEEEWRERLWLESDEPCSFLFLEPSPEAASI